ncbi:hypothetical protein C2845_PM18G01550 [Panicum miliaceum]|uniref:Uncharacterized protein n=1 Tax=Panicum miliaceum TaxID=4540 RepID=A0A3L6PG28_PANMI|nr:hypothetical protein C2845_PM18G01550 [Panicum miliaceum]
MVKKNKFVEVWKGVVDAEHVSSGDESSNGFDDLDCGYTPPEREEYAVSDKAVETKQQHSVLSFNRLIDVVKELSGRIELMEKKQAWSNKEVKYLQGVNERLLKRIVELKGTVKTLNSKIDPSTLDDSLNQFVEQCSGSEDVIYLVCGFDGFSFLPSLDSFSPSLDILTPLKPMAVGKSYASTVALDGKVFVLGGGDVDYYDQSRDDWTTCPSLTHDKGSLAGVSVNGRIYAFGGGDGSQCFSDIEIFDPTHGKWIKNQPMLQKRLALAGVALNGVIYAVGGFNGAQYLRYRPFPAYTWYLIASVLIW